MRLDEAKVSRAAVLQFGGAQDEREMPIGDHPEEVNDAILARQVAHVEVLSLMEIWTKEHETKMAEMKAMCSSQAGFAEMLEGGEFRADEEALAAPKRTVGDERIVQATLMTAASRNRGLRRGRHQHPTVSRLDRDAVLAEAGDGG
eukprot:CAMPEP_0177157226 /NCGR_PEP_ID=MMETSP0367-20130122/3140_1 /TAXON_ID=447022 ORGANISM="Scrippsiella hangoei-like, Strain SHHI-4" /NCGR_SAMPLE_ID=MMETSP0367 /ASSEMBLY_ACC=CAM_ASM_000362 /LENGTH=145 /DNA_ID=CAMNT_0018602719 /DNA_START=1 /DNA_END=436 /DNA_ORIENTATION=-